MDLVVLGGNKEEKLVNSLFKELSKVSRDFRFVHVNDLSELAGADVIYMAQHALKLDYEKLSHDFKMINSYQAMKNVRDKIKTTVFLEKAGISQPDYIIAKNLEEIIHFTKPKGQTILKFPFGCAGNGHAVLFSENGQLFSYNSKMESKVEDEGDHLLVNDMVHLPPYLIQEFISSGGSKINDRVYRVYVVGHEAKFGTLRVKDNVKKPSDSIINIAQGAHYEFIPALSEEMKHLALRTAEATGFDIGVVDLLEDKKGQAYVIECDCDGRFLMVDRKFMEKPDFCDRYNFNKMIGKRLIEIAQGAAYRS